MNVTSSILIFMAILAATACATDEASRYYAHEKFPPRPPNEVEVYRTKPTRPFDVIADLQARNRSVEYMRKRAAQIGADAIIVSLLGGYRSESDVWASEDRYGNTYSRITATAIRFK